MAKHATLVEASEFLDLLEKIAIDALMPAMMELMKVMPKDKQERDIREATRRVLGTIGTRIAFGKETHDQIFHKNFIKDSEKPR